jgi:hypothetical protein
MSSTIDGDSKRKIMLLLVKTDVIFNNQTLQ